MAAQVMVGDSSLVSIVSLVSTDISTTWKGSSPLRHPQGNPDCAKTTAPFTDMRPKLQKNAQISW